MVAGIGIGDGGIFAACRPVEFAGVNDDTAKCCTVTAEELGSGMHHDICTVFDRTDKIRSAEGVIDYQRQAVLMCKLGQSIDIGNIAVGIAQRLNINGAGIVLNGCLNFREVVNVDKGCGDAEVGEGMGQQIVAAAIDGFLRYDMTAVLTKGFQCVSDGCCTGSQSQSSNAALQRGDTAFSRTS